MSLAAKCLEAASAQDVESGESGLWSIDKLPISNPEGLTTDGPKGEEIHLPEGVYTNLWRWTTATLHHGRGELVMHDFPKELRKHLQFMLSAHGRVLITGLGLGCVARGCLANPAVKHVVVVEKSPDVMRLVARYMPRKGLTIVFADALRWCAHNTRRFDCAWHDLWSDESEGEPHLQLLHAELIRKMMGKASFQGAWELPRWFRRTVEGVI